MANGLFDDLLSDDTKKKDAEVAKGLFDDLSSGVASKPAVADTPIQPTPKVTQPPSSPLVGPKPLSATERLVTPLPDIGTDSSRIYGKSGAEVVDTKQKDIRGMVPTHRINQKTNRQPGESWEQYEQRVINTPSFNNTEKVTDINQLSPNMHGNVNRFIAMAKRDGIKLTVNETRRSQERQEMLFQQGRKKGDKRPTVTWTLTSDHADGNAVDFRSDKKGYAWIQENGPKFGFTVLGDVDPGHISLPVSDEERKADNQTFAGVGDLLRQPMDNRPGIAVIQPLFHPDENPGDLGTVIKAVSEVQKGLRPELLHHRIGEAKESQFAPGNTFGRTLADMMGMLGHVPEGSESVPGSIAANVISFGMGAITTPFAQAANGYRELYHASAGDYQITESASSLLPPHLRLVSQQYYKEQLGTMDPYEAEEARRGFIAGAASIITGGAAAKFVSPLGGIASASAGIGVGVPVFGMLEKEEPVGDKLQRSAAYMLAAIPFALITDGLMAGLGKASKGLVPEDIATLPAAHEFAQTKATRAFDEPTGTPSTLRQKVADVIYPEGKERRANLERQVETDEMTGVSNRTAFEKALPSAEADPGTSVIVFDGDNFGRVNKEVGYAAGDKAIVDIADAIQTAAQEHGVNRVFRHGSGDEFSVLAPVDVAEKIRSRAEEIYGTRKYGGVEVGLSGDFANTFKEADVGMQIRKQLKKGIPESEIVINGQSREKLAVVDTPDRIVESIDYVATELMNPYEGQKDPTALWRKKVHRNNLTDAELAAQNLPDEGPDLPATPWKYVDTGNKVVKNKGWIQTTIDPDGQIYHQMAFETFDSVYDSMVGDKRFVEKRTNYVTPPPADAVVNTAATKVDATQIAKNNLIESLVAIAAVKKGKGEVGHVTVVPGVTFPGEVLRAIHNMVGPDQMVAIHPRPDGLFDIAFGDKGSKLNGSQKQFAGTGYYEGQPVYINGKDYLYKTSLNSSESLVSEPLAKGVSKPIKVKTSDIRRAADQQEVLARDYKLSELKEILDEDTYKALEKLINDPTVQVTPEYSASTNKLRIERGPAGGYHVVDGDNGKIVGRGFATKDEAVEFVNQTDQTGGPPLEPPNDVGDVVGLIPPDEPKGPIEDMFIPRVGRITSIVDAFSSALTRMFKFFHIGHDRWMQMDKDYPGLNAFKMFTDTQKWKNEANVVIHQWHEKAKAVEKFAMDNNLTYEQRKLVGEWIETVSADELAKVIGPDNLRYGEQLARLGPNISTKRAYDYIRQKNWEISQIEQQKGEVDGFAIDGVETALAKTMKMSRGEMQAVRIIEQATAESNNTGNPTVDVDIVTRYANAVHDKTMSRTDFAKYHQFTGAMLKYAQDSEKLFGAGGDYLGIDKLKYYGYLQHARTHTAGSDLGSAFLGKANLEKTFISDMYRKGDVISYNLDPTTNFVNYIYKGVLLKEFMPKFRVAVRDMEANMERMGLDLEKSEVGKELRGYENDILGIPSTQDAVISDAINKAIRTLPWLKGVNISVVNDFVNPTTSLINASTQGFRQGMGFRDFIDGSKKYFYKFDLGRTKRMLQLGAAADIDAMKQMGIVVGLDRYEFQTADEGAAFGVVKPERGMIRQGVKKISEVGLKASLQPLVYQRMQAGIYLEMMERASQQLRNLSADNGFKGKNEVYKKIGVFKFDEPVRQTFDGLVNAEKFAGASDYLARMAIYDVIGKYGLGNNPWGGRSIFGRLALNLGTWSMQTKGYVSRGITVGTRSDRLGFAARMAVGETALAGLGALTGLNMRSYYMLAGVPFAGGPLFQLAQMAVKASQGNRQDEDLFLKNIYRFIPSGTDPRSIFLPGSYAFADWWFAINNNDVDTPAKFMGRVGGIPPGPTKVLDMIPGGEVTSSLVDKAIQKTGEILQ